ncbi:hypothetical protein K1719_001618 [Acacia pycnantha]|nr:hypothetical protein K1719_001618 [Acacia pycnantha]
MARKSYKPFLPFEIIINILKRLPIKSIVRFQCVCKDWKNLFTVPSFIAEQVLHSARENPFLLIHDYDYKYRRSSLRLLNQKMETAEVLSTHSIDSLRRRWRINGSCNGLLCVELDTEEGRFPVSYLLWNPVMNEIVRLYHPELLKKKEDQSSFYTNLNRAQMFSLSTGSWKELEFGALNTKFPHDAVSANGNIFWFGLDFFPMIVSFHIATEVFTFTSILTVQSSVDVAEHCCGPFRLDVHGEVEGKGKDKGDLKDFLYLFNLTTKEWTKFHNFSAAYGRCAIFNYESSVVSVGNI